LRRNVIAPFARVASNPHTQPVMSVRTDHLRSLDKRFVWHPFTHQSLWEADETLVITDADGLFLIDSDGNRYFDGVSSLWCNVHGHRVPEIDAAIRAQLDRVAHSTLLGLAGEASARLAEALIRIAPPGLARVFFSDAGACATEIAFKMAAQYWWNVGKPEKRGFVGFIEGYHGDTVGAMSVGRSTAFQKPFVPMLFPIISAPSPYEYRWPANVERRLSNVDQHVSPTIHNPRSTIVRDSALQQLESLLQQHASNLAAICIEPLVQGAAGMIVHPPGFLRGVRELATKYDVLLICDEIAVGFGRTGRMFACEHEDVSPDLMCLGKGITGGYLPLAATLATQNIYDAFMGEPWEGKTFFHGHTFGGNPLACAAALASIELFEARQTLAHVNAMSTRLTEKLQALEHLPRVGDVRQRGLMVGIELVADRATKRPFDPRARVGAGVCRRMRDRHRIIVRPLGDVIVLMPPLSIDAEHLDRLVAAAHAEIAAIGDTPASDASSAIDIAGDA
jgi:adenosylmethionine---8-amino-7-oxononanoate aminotransferase